MGETQFDCRLTRTTSGTTATSNEQSFFLFPPAQLPHLVELSPSQGGIKNKGYLLSAVFSLNMLNLQSQPLSLEFRLDPPRDVETIESSIVDKGQSQGSSQGQRDKSQGQGTISPLSLHVRQALPSMSPRYRSQQQHNTQYLTKDADVSGGGDGVTVGGKSSTGRGRSAVSKDKGQGQGLGSTMPLPGVILAPGQTLSLPLELYSEPELALAFVPCRRGHPFTLTVTPSRGAAIKASFELECRRVNQSFLLSYVDHDGSVAQTAV